MSSFLLSVTAIPAPGFLFSHELRRKVLAKIGRLEDLTDLDLRPAAEWRALEPLDRLFSRFHLPEPEACNQLLGLREWPVDHRLLAVLLEAHASALRARLEPFAREHDARLHQLLVEVAHLGELFLRRQLAGFGLLRRFDYDHESHCELLV